MFQLIVSNATIMGDRDADAPKFQRFIEEIMPDADTRSVLQNMAGYCLMNTCCFHKIFVLVGDSCTGKSAFLKILSELLGRENVSTLGLDELDIEKCPMGAKANICDGVELKGGGEDFARWAARLEEISGGLLGFVGRKRRDGGEDNGEEVDGLPQAATVDICGKLIFAANGFPGFDARCWTLRKRLVFIPFTQSFKGRENPALADEIIAEEMPGVLNWALEGRGGIEERLEDGHGDVFESDRTRAMSWLYWTGGRLNLKG